LTTRPDIDPAHIGMMGISLGGMNTWFAAAADPRIAVAVALIGVQVAILIHISCNHPWSCP
jgi:dienelactone hydrolase